ncbi:MAG: hypothetical protein ACLQOZ_15620 [Acidimicrobiales bacterium]
MQATPTRRSLGKVPEVTAYFWIIKVLTTGMGESTSDFFVKRFVPQAAVAVTGLLLAAVLVLQFRVSRYLAWVYWLAVVMVSVFGTMAADVLHIQFKVPYVVSTIFFAVVLASVFLVWDRYEGTLSIHSITTQRREAFYWLTVLTTFALGTAAGDLTATTLGLGYLASGMLFAVLIAVPAVGSWKFGMNEVLAFWFAYILTRPLGASFADWMAVSHVRGGLDLGPGLVSLALSALIVAFVAFLAITRKDVRTDSGDAG